MGIRFYSRTEFRPTYRRDYHRPPTARNDSRFSVGYVPPYRSYRRTAVLSAYSIVLWNRITLSTIRPTAKPTSTSAWGQSCSIPTPLSSTPRRI